MRGREGGMTVLQEPEFSEAVLRQQQMDLRSEGKVAGTKEELQRRSVLIRSEMCYLHVRNSQTIQKEKT